MNSSDLPADKPAEAADGAAPQPETNGLGAVELPPPVDMERLLDFANGNPDNLRELVELYLQQTERQVEQLCAAVSNGAAEDTRRLAHSCAWASSTCGMAGTRPAAAGTRAAGRGRLGAGRRGTGPGRAPGIWENPILSGKISAVATDLRTAGQDPRMKKIVIVEDDELVAPRLPATNWRRTATRSKWRRTAKRGWNLSPIRSRTLVILGLDGAQNFRRGTVGAENPRWPGLETLPVIVFSSTYLSDPIQKCAGRATTKCISKAICTSKQMLELVRKLVSPSAPAAAGSVPSSSPAPASAAAIQAESAADASCTQADLRQSFLESLRRHPQQPAGGLPTAEPDLRGGGAGSGCSMNCFAKFMP